MSEAMSPPGAWPVSSPAEVGLDPGAVREAVAIASDPAGDHNSRITWEHLLQNRSEWEGTLWGKPDVADRREGVGRRLRAPGAFWEYNDVRVNLCAYALLYVLGRPLPEVLDEAIMRPIGASQDWEWHGYDTSWVEIGGRRVQSVAGGGHWGGGVIISALDMARFGLLYLNRGRWGEEQLLSQEWVEGSVASCPIRADYGRLWWLNRSDDTKLWPPVPEEALAARGYGGNTILVDPRHRLVAVTRWITDEAHLAFLEALMRACGHTTEESDPTSDPASRMQWR